MRHRLQIIEYTSEYVPRRNYNGITHEINPITILYSLTNGHFVKYFTYRGMILFWLYYDAKECTFTVYAQDAGGIGDDGATLLINLSRGRAKRKICRCAIPIFIRREKMEQMYSRCANKRAFADVDSRTFTQIKAFPPIRPFQG